MKNIIEWTHDNAIILIIVAIVLSTITFSWCDYSYGWHETIIKIESKTWERSVYVSSDSKSGKIHYYLQCDIGKMEVNKNVYNKAITGREYLVLTKDIRIRKIIKEINTKGELDNG